MATGFTSPGVMFIGSIPKPTRDLMAQVLHGLKDRGYNRLVEPCSGSLAVSLLATEMGWKPQQVEASDITLYSSVLGYVGARRDLAELDVKLDGETFELDGSPEEQAAQILFMDTCVRMEKKAHIPYWEGLLDELTVNSREYQESIVGRLRALVGRIGGMSYTPMDLWDHVEQAADDPQAVISCNPPNFAGSYEAYFDTEGRVTWDEPEFREFNASIGYDALHDYLADRPALTLNFYEDLEPGSYENPVFVKPKGKQKRSYVLSNRPDEVFAITGGPKLAPRPSSGLERAEERPILPMDHPITEESTIGVHEVGTPEADYYRAIWMHKFKTNGGSYNLLVTIDGYAAGIIGYSLDPLVRPLGKPQFLALLRFAFGAPHNVFRTTRLVTMLSLRKQELDLFGNGKSSMYIEQSRGLITNARTKYPESKSLRGIMELKSRKEEDGQNMLVYVADWNGIETREGVLEEWLKRERHWQAASQQSQKPRKKRRRR